MKLHPEPFEQIKSGRKNVELRLYDEKRSRINIGDEIIFTCLSRESEKIDVRVRALYRYATFKELFQKIPPENCGFETCTAVDEAAAEMRKYYSEDQENRYGVLGIRIDPADLEEAIARRI